MSVLIEDGTKRRAIADSGADTTTSQGFDTLGQASVLGGDAMTALRRVVAVIAARQPGPLQAVPGANHPIWRVTDDVDAPDDPDAVSILQAAGVPPAATDHTYAAPHINDVAGGSQTVALGPSGPLLAPPVQGVLPPANVAPSLGALSITPQRPRVRSKRAPTVLTAQLTVTPGARALEAHPGATALGTPVALSAPSRPRFGCRSPPRAASARRA